MELDILVPDIFDIALLIPRELLLESHLSGNLYDLPGVAHGFPRHGHDLFIVLCPAFRVSEKSLPLDPQGGWQDHVCDIGCGCGIYLGYDDKAALLFGTVPIAPQVGDGHHGVGHLDPHESDIPAIQRPEHRHRMIGWLGVDVFHRHIPYFGRHFAGALLHDDTMGEFMGQGTDLTDGTACAGLAGQGKGAVAG